MEFLYSSCQTRRRANKQKKKNTRLVILPANRSGTGSPGGAAHSPPRPSSWRGPSPPPAGPSGLRPRSPRLPAARLWPEAYRSPRSARGPSRPETQAEFRRAAAARTEGRAWRGWGRSTTLAATSALISS